MTPIATNCTQDLVEKVKELAELEERVFYVASEEEVVERTKGMSYPCVGVVYHGIVATEEQGASSKTGDSANLMVSIMLFFRQNTTATNDPKDAGVELLDEIRQLILRTRSPTGHFWKLQLEVPVEGRRGVLLYLQRWSTPVQLTSLRR